MLLLLLSSVFSFVTKVKFVARPYVITNKGSCAKAESLIYFFTKQIASWGEGAPRKEPELILLAKAGGKSAGTSGWKTKSFVFKGGSGLNQTLYIYGKYIYGMVLTK